MNLKQRISKFFIGPSRYGSTVWNWMIPGEWGKDKLLSQYKNYAYPIISAIAEEAAKVTLEVSKKTAKDIIPVPNHEILKLIENPNPMNSQFSFLELHFTFMKLCGESYWYMPNGEKSKKPKEIYLIRPDLMKVVVDKDDPSGKVIGYILNRGAGKETPFDLEEIIHHKMPNPLDPYYGFGTIQAARVYLQTEKYAADWTRNSIYNSGRPSGILNIKGIIDKAEFDQLKRQFKQEYEGTENAGKTLLLKGMDEINFEKLGMELDGAAMKEVKDMSRDDIMMMFRVSKTMLGISEGVNVSNAQENRLMFIDSVIKPELDRLVDALQKYLVPRFGTDLVLSYENPSMQTDAQKREMYIAGHNKWLTTNDIRMELGMAPLLGGDVIREPVQLVPTSGGSEVKRLKMLKKKAKSDRVEVFHKLLFDNQAQWEDKYLRFMRVEFNHQLKEILGKKSFTDWLFDLNASKTRIVGSLVPFGIELMKESAKFAFDLANDPDNELEVDESVKRYIHDRVDTFATATNDESVKAIEQTIAEGVADGESISELKKRLKQVYAFADDVRAERIARTETLAASNAGAAEAYKQSPLVVAKEWSAESNACEFCLELDGKIVGLEESFAELGEDVSGSGDNSYRVGYETLETPPLHPNCRCAILPVAQ